MWNRRVEEVTGYATDEIASMRPTDFFRGDDVPYIVERIAKVFQEGQSDADAMLVAKDGTRTPYYFTGTRTVVDGKPCCVGMGVDITELKDAEMALRKSEALFRAITENAHDIATIMMTNGSITYESSSIRRILGYEPEDVVGRNAFEYIHPDDHNAVYEAITRELSHPGMTSVVEHRFRHRDGSWRILSSAISNLVAEPAVEGLVVSSRDVTETRRAEESIRHMALHDPLTGLANRSVVQSRIDQAVKQSRRDDHIGAVMFLDLDRFKLINDTFGHQRGDLLLRAVAQRLETCVRTTDTLGRHGGDEFVILLQRITAPIDAAVVAQKIQDALLEPFSVDGTEIAITPSIGICIYPFDGTDSGTLIRHADLAMYRAKDCGRNNYQFFTAEMNVQVLHELEVEIDLRRAVRVREFRLAYQPVVDIAKGAITGFEALLRWQHPSKGLIMPASFIRIAEDTGLIVPIGEWAIQEACAAVRAWHDAGFIDLTVNVNLSPRQFQRTNIVEQVERALDKSGADPRCLGLEITERVLMADIDQTVDTLDSLRRLGIRILIDDFGTGYSSLAYLKRLSIDTLKIDQSFVSDVVTNPDDAAIVSAVIALAHNLDIGVIAEGVESAEQAEFLHRGGCLEMQGHVFAGPQEAESVARGLAEYGIAKTSLPFWACPESRVRQLTTSRRVG
jgi:diguanylate cyclase (GGDEF)-like protein/PAS domain S-box-containing protein